MADKQTRLAESITSKVLEERVGNPIRISFGQTGSIVARAEEVALKPVMKTPANRRILGRNLLDLVKKGPDRGRFLLVDTRPAEEYLERHIPGSISIEPGTLRKHLNDLPSEKDSPVIFYAESASWPTPLSMAQESETLGYTNAGVYLGGIVDWIMQGKQPVSIAPDYLDRLLREDRYPVIIDVREKVLVSQGVIPGAVVIPVDSLGSMKKQFPEDRKAPVVIYGQGRINSDVVKASQTISEWGFTRVSVLEEGFAGWKKAGYRVQEGRPNIMIGYLPWEKPGQTNMYEFMDIVDSISHDVVLLDVRPKEELTRGSIRYAISIPLRELAARTREIPKGLRVVAFSSDPRGSEIAAAILEQQGFESSWLAGVFSMDSQGTYAVQ